MNNGGRFKFEFELGKASVSVCKQRQQSGSAQIWSSVFSKSASMSSAFSWHVAVLTLGRHEC
jgi:hypothetical protein